MEIVGYEVVEVTLPESLGLGSVKNEILKGLEKDEYKLLQKTLKKYNNNGKMYIEVFFKTYEDISLEKNIQKVETEKEEE